MMSLDSEHAGSGEKRWRRKKTRITHILQKRELQEECS